MGKLCARGKAAAKRKFRVYPSAYANAYAVKVCKGDVKGPDSKKRSASGYSNLGHTYEIPSGKDKNFLTGGSDFIIEEMEVFQYGE